MRPHIQLSLLKLADPQAVRILLFGLTLALMLLALMLPALMSLTHSPVRYLCPAGAGGDCGGG